MHLSQFPHLIFLFFVSSDFLSIILNELLKKLSWTEFFWFRNPETSKDDKKQYGLAIMAATWPSWRHIAVGHRGSPRLKHLQFLFSAHRVHICALNLGCVHVLQPSVLPWLGICLGTWTISVISVCLVIRHPTSCSATCTTWCYSFSTQHTMALSNLSQG